MLCDFLLLPFAHIFYVISARNLFTKIYFENSHIFCEEFSFFKFKRLRKLDLEEVSSYAITDGSLFGYKGSGSMLVLLKSGKVEEFMFNTFALKQELVSALGSFNSVLFPYSSFHRKYWNIKGTIAKILKPY